MKYDFNKKIYLITDEKLILRKKFIERIKEAAISGIDIIQIREKKSTIRERLELSREVIKAVKKMNIKVIINDDPYLARAVGADGVHIGKNDGDIKLAKNILGKRAIVGVSCYGDIELALQMQRDGADYVSFGNVFLSPTKPEEKIISLEVIKKARERLKIPIVAIGGINSKNASSVFEAGADCVSVISDILRKKEIKKAISDFNYNFKSIRRNYVKK